MAKIRFDAESFGVTTGTHDGYVGGPASGCAHVPTMGGCTGIQAIIEGLRLADIQCHPSVGGGLFANDVNA